MRQFQGASWRIFCDVSNGLPCDSPDEVPRAISLLLTNAEFWLSLSRGARATGGLLRWDVAAALWEEHIRFFLK